MNHAESDDFKNVGMVAVIFLGLVSVILMLPIFLLSLIFSYFTWASYKEKLERRWVRTAAILLSGFFVVAGVWETFKVFAPLLFAEVFSKNTIKVLTSTEVFRFGYLGYFLLIGIGVYLFDKKLRPNFNSYLIMRRFFILSLFPFKFIYLAIQKAFGFVGFILTRGKLKKTQSKFGLLALVLMLLSSEVVISLSLWIFKQKPAFMFGTGIACAYLLLSWYYTLSSKYRKNQISVTQLSRQADDGVRIGTMIRPRHEFLELDWKDINHHIHILGQPGAGKSVLIKNIYAGLISKGAGLMMIDLKADRSVREDFLNLCTVFNRQKDLIIIDLSHPKNSCGYNPLLFGNATELKDKIIGSIEWSEPYYKKTSESVLLTILRGMVWLRDVKGLVPNFEDLLSALTSLQALNILCELVDEQNIKSDIYQLMQDSKKDYSKNIEGLRAEISLLVKSEFGEILTKHGAISILDCIRQNKVILVNLDGQTYSESAKKFGRMLLGDLRAASGAIVTNLKSSERPKFTLIIDEFADIVSTDEMARTFVGFLNRCRGSGIGVVIAHQ